MSDKDFSLDDLIRRENEATENQPVTISQIADFRLGRQATTGEDFASVGLQMLGGCERCGASIACYNACPSKSGYWRCQDCIGDRGFNSVEEANQFLIGNQFGYLCPTCKQGDQLSVVASVWRRLVPNGTDDDQDGDQEWDDTASAKCACGWSGLVRDLGEN